MKRHILIGVLTLVLIPGTVGAVTIGAGAFGGTSIPVVQDDTGSGALFGLRVPLNFVPLIAVEPFYAQSSGGSVDQTVAGVSQSRDGIDVTSFGANVLFTFGTGMKLFPFAGISSNHLERAGMDDTQTGYDFGLGLGLKLPALGPVSGLSADIRGALNMVVDPATSDASRKWTDITIGVSYPLFHSSP